MRYTFDTLHDTLYIELSDADSVRQEEMDDGVIVDLSTDGKVVAIEVISARHSFDIRAIAERYKMDDDEVKLLVGASAPPPIRVLSSRLAFGAPQIASEAEQPGQPRVLANALGG